MINWKIPLLLLCLSTTGCSMLAQKAGEALLGASDKGIEANANVGKAETEGDSSVAQNANTAVSGQVNSESTEEVTYQAPVERVVNEAGLDWWVLALIVMLAGWAIPSPGEMLRGLVDLFRPLNRRRRFGSERD